MTAIPAYGEVAVLLAQLDPSKIINLKPSQLSYERLSVLLEKIKIVILATKKTMNLIVCWLLTI